MTETPAQTPLQRPESAADSQPALPEGGPAPAKASRATKRLGTESNGTRPEPSVTPWPSASSGCSEPRSSAWPPMPCESPWFCRRLGLLDYDQGLVGPQRIVERCFELCWR